MYHKLRNIKTSNPSATGFAASANECPGTYYVEGYKRADGKEVAGYYRSCSVHGNAGGIRKKRIDEMTQQELDDLLERII